MLLVRKFILVGGNYQKQPPRYPIWTVDEKPPPLPPRFLWNSPHTKKNMSFLFFKNTINVAFLFKQNENASVILGQNKLTLSYRRFEVVFRFSNNTTFRWNIFGI